MLSQPVAVLGSKMSLHRQHTARYIPNPSFRLGEFSPPTCEVIMDRDFCLLLALHCCLLQRSFFLKYHLEPLPLPSSEFLGIVFVMTTSWITSVLRSQPPSLNQRQLSCHNAQEPLLHPPGVFLLHLYTPHARKRDLWSPQCICVLNHVKKQKMSDTSQAYRDQS